MANFWSTRGPLRPLNKKQVKLMTQNVLHGFGERNPEKIDESHERTCG